MRQLCLLTTQSGSAHVLDRATAEIKNIDVLSHANVVSVARDREIDIASKVAVVEVAVAVNEVIVGAEKRVEVVADAVAVVVATSVVEAEVRKGADDTKVKGC